MTRKRGRGTPRLLRPTSWSVKRLARWQRRPGEGLADVTMLTVDGSWEHNQHQEVRVPFPTGEVEGLVHALLGAAAIDDVAPEGGQVLPPAGLATTSPPAAASSGVAAGGGPGAPAGGAVQATSSPAGTRSQPDRHAYVLDMLRERLAEYFDGRQRAGAAFVDTALRKHEVPTLEDLPTAALASLFNQLQAAPPSRSTPQGDTPHDHHRTTGP